MKKWYVYISEYGTRVYTNIFEAESKDDVKAILLSELDWLDEVKMRRSKKGLNQFITSIYEIDDYWHSIFLKSRKCINCLNSFTKVDKTKYNTGGRSDFCSSECDSEYSKSFDPYATSTWDNGSVYMITHEPTGKFYVGVTTRWLMQRWWEHMKAESGSKFHQFIKENPIEEFNFKILEQFKPSEVNPYDIESKWINKLNATQVGLNTVKGHAVSTRVDSTQQHLI